MGIRRSSNSTFAGLTHNIEHVHELTASTAKSVVNQLLTVRNWMIGCYIVEFEQKGKDRAEYGTRLLHNLAERLNIKGLDRTHINLCRLFYLKYPQIGATVSHKFAGANKLLSLPAFSGTAANDSQANEEICATVNHKFEMPA